MLATKKVRLLFIALILCLVPCRNVMADGNSEIISILSIALSDSVVSPSVPVPDTGASVCYGEIGEIVCPDPGAPFYGQDAQYISNPLSYIDNGDGTVTDTVTGLMWMQSDDGNLYNWDNAVAYCSQLVLAGYTDWHLPNRRELFQLVDFGRESPAIDPVFSAQPNWHWTSTSYAGDSNCAWYLNFNNGYLFNGEPVCIEKSVSLYVRCVRSGQ
ncbi:DUF1566 domain-containing protein [Desulfovibrio inopinatus]|uniref:Lcl C-terminal domain-containing protein n=1 Tax=Desulfovibrio inopinatus TaxID=102109 RepID=UPI0003F994C5|nr:DUF1566 domain-containing protein [Desulfovibrio inopinatus]